MFDDLSKANPFDKEKKKLITFTQLCASQDLAPSQLPMEKHI